MSEKTLVTDKIIAYINNIPMCRAVKVHGGMFGHTGEPDIMACMHGGLAVFIECKKEDNEPTMIQRLVMNKWKQAGAIVFTAHSLDEAKIKLREKGIGNEKSK